MAVHEVSAMLSLLQQNCGLLECLFAIYQVEQGFSLFRSFQIPEELFRKIQTPAKTFYALAGYP
jgi:hypothetical protein